MSSNTFVPRKARISRFAAMLRDALPEGIALDTNRRVEIMGRSTPVLGYGGSVLNLDCSIPDRFTARTGVTATIFVKSGQDFIRISTSVRKQNGERAIGTALSHAHPGYAQLLAGRSYIGYATLFGAQYLTEYDALKDARGRVIGASYVGIDVTHEGRISLGAMLAVLLCFLTGVAFTVLIWHFAGSVSDLVGSRSGEIAAARNAHVAFGLAAALVLAGVLYRVLHLSLTRPLSDARNVAQKLSAGDLTALLHVDRNDEIGQLMQAVNGVSQGLADIVGNVRQGSGQITEASREIAIGNLDLSSRTSEQAASLEETASSMAQLTATVRQNADNAQQANQFVLSASGVAGKGGQVVAQVVEMMTSIRRSSQQIAGIVSEIEAIAFQTNILALNAAVEAARAGEHGRSFAVVAHDVRNLAQRSGIAAKKIKTLITGSVAQVDEGGALAERAGKTMTDIVTSVKRVADIMGEITAASREQSSGIEQINLAIGQMDEITQQNAALVEEAAAAAESLRVQAEKLSQAMAVFKLP